jgi:DNA-binding NtrC family response regulator
MLELPPCKLAFGKDVAPDVKHFIEDRLSLKFRLEVSEVSLVDDLFSWPADSPILLVLSMKNSTYEQIRRWSHSHPFLQLLIFDVKPEQAAMCHRSGAWEMLGENDDLRVRFPILESRLQEWVNLRLPVFRTNEKTLVPSISPTMRKIYQRLQRVKDRQAHIWLEGEAGTGKKMFARELHRESAFSHRPFYTIHIHGGDDVEKMLFGAKNNGRIEPGFLELAQGATIYIDGILAMPLACQVRLMQAIRDAAVEHDGQKIPFQARLVCASRTSPEKAIAKGNFLADLYHTLSDIHQKVPALRERRDDIPLLAKHFASSFSQENEYDFLEFSAKSIQKLMQHDWPGNIRELRSVSELSVVVSPNDVIEPEHVFIHGMPFRDDEIDISLQEYTRRFIQEKLRAYDYNVLETAKKIGVGKSTLYRMIQNGELEIK